MAELNTLDEEVFGKAYDARLMKRLLRYLGPYQWRVAIAVVVLILASATQVVGPWLTQIIIDEAIPLDIKTGSPVPTPKLEVVGGSDS